MKHGQAWEGSWPGWDVAFQERLGTLVRQAEPYSSSSWACRPPKWGQALAGTVPVPEPFLNSDPWPFEVTRA